MEKKEVLVGEAYLQFQRERKREYYAEHRDECLKKAKERYHAKKEKLQQSGVEPKTRGRPRKEWKPCCQEKTNSPDQPVQ